MKTFLIMVSASLLLAGSGCSVNVGMQKTEKLEEVVLSRKEADEKILLVPIDGMISFEPGRSSLFNKEPSIVASLREQLDKARNDEQVKGVILRINSPGGTLGATQMIHEELERFRKETGVYILGLYLEVAASGALYLSMAADYLMAYPSAITGSMGVLFVSPNFQELGKKVGIEYRVVKSGSKKDMGSPFRNWPPEERRLLEDLANHYNDQFKEVVFMSRKPHGMSEKDFELLADARILSADQALKIHLVDEVGTLNAAIANIEKKNNGRQMRVVTYTRYPRDATNVYSRTYGVSSLAPTTDSQGMLEKALQVVAPEGALSKGFYYLW